MKFIVKNDDSSLSVSSGAKNLIGAVMAFIILLIAATSLHETVPVGEEASVSSWGKVQPGVNKTGAGFKAPWETYDTYNLQSRTYTFNGVGVAAQDKFKNSMDISYTGRFLPGYASKIRNTTGTAEVFISTHVHKTVRACAVKAGLTKSNSQDFFFETAQIEMAEYTLACANEYLDSGDVGGGYAITKVQFSKIDLDPRVEKFMVKTKERLEAEEQQKSDARIAESKARELVAKEKADADAAIHRATKDRTIADAKFYAVQKEAEGNLLLSKSVSTDLADYIRANKWDGKQPQIMTGVGTELQIQK